MLGVLAGYLFKSHNRPGELIGVVVFDSEARDHKVRAPLEADPEWNDGDIFVALERASWGLRVAATLPTGLVSALASAGNLVRNGRRFVVEVSQLASANLPLAAVRAPAILLQGAHDPVSKPGWLARVGAGRGGGNPRAPPSPLPKEEAVGGGHYRGCSV